MWQNTNAQILDETFVRSSKRVLAIWSMAPEHLSMYRVPSRSFIVSVIGLGRIGLPHALVSAHSGNSVYGFDSNEIVIRSLKLSRANFAEDGVSELLKETLGSRFFVVDDLGLIKDSEVVLVAVGINYMNGERKADLEPLLGLCEKISR